MSPVERQHILESPQLKSGMCKVRGFRIGQMAIDSFDLEMVAAERALQESLCIVIVHTRSFHAGVDLEMHLELGPSPPRRRLCRFEQLQGRGRKGEPQSDKGFNLLGQN